MEQQQKHNRPNAATARRRGRVEVIRQSADLGWFWTPRRVCEVFRVSHPTAVSYLDEAGVVEYRSVMQKRVERVSACFSQGLNIRQTSEALNLTRDQVRHALEWYIRPAQLEDA